MNIEDLREQFDDLGANASEDVLAKCLEICLSHGFDDAEEFVEKWMAYSISNLGGADPTIERLAEMENRELNKVKGTQSKNLKRSSEKSSNLKVYKQGNIMDDEVDEEESALLGSYVCLTPKNDNKAVSRIQKGTPDVAKKAAFSPVSYSPLATKRSRIESLKTGNVVCSFGNYAAASSTISEKNHLEVSINIDTSKWIDEKYMTTSVIDDGQFITERIYKVGTEISRKVLADQNRNDPEDQLALTHCDELSQEDVHCLGKIFCGGRSNKLDQKSTLFVGFDENKMRAVQLDLSRLKPSATIFPGEICVVTGNNPRGKNFAVTDIHSERLLTHSELPLNLSEPLSFVVASAPFTTKDNLLFEPLEKLIENCQNNKPNVLILTGPFFNSSSKLIFDLATEVDEHFKKMLTDVGERLGEDTKIVIVASGEDINSASCYPTRPYRFKRGGSVLPSNIFLAPDPCVLDINGIKIALTSIDITQHLNDSEFCMNAGGDKIRRYMNYLFHQKSFYPLFPPKIPTDIRLIHEYATIDEIPHILVAPSDLKYYMRDFNNCLCVNPGRLSPSETSAATPEGSFARLIVQTPPKGANNTNAWISGQVVYL